MKATTLFGGVQVFNILIAIVRSKIIAVLLGPMGMGVSGLLTSTTGLVGAFTNFGLGTSAIKDIAAAAETKDNEKIATIAIVFRRLVWITGLLGTLLTIILSPWLSQTTFGNHQYTLSFIFLSVTLLFGQLSSGRQVLLQGLRKLKSLAKVNVVGSVLGLLLTIPLFYFWGIAAIVPVLLITSIVLFIVSWIFSRDIRIDKVLVSAGTMINESKKMLIMGFLISLSGLTAMGASYILRVFITKNGGIIQVGLYNAGFTIITTYVGMVFTAMGTDYFPRLSAQVESNDLCCQTVNQQAEIAVLILAPIILVFLIFVRWIVVLFYSKQFVDIVSMVQWAALGMLFKAVGWAIAFLFLAKGRSRLFFINELVANIYMLALNVIAYKLFGLTGLGFSFLIGYIVYALQVFIISKVRFNFSFSNSFIGIFLIQLILVTLCMTIVKLLISQYSYIIGSILIIISCWYSLTELNKKIGIISLKK
jgi:O-antigen/teichoic acid export membrane protein